MAATTVKVKEPKRSRALVRQETIASYLFLLPSLIFFLGFVIYPMILCVVTSFFDSTMNRADVFVGLQNYIELFQDSATSGRNIWMWWRASAKQIWVRAFTKNVRKRLSVSLRMQKKNTLCAIPT